MVMLSKQTREPAWGAQQRTHPPEAHRLRIGRRQCHPRQHDNVICTTIKMRAMPSSGLSHHDGINRIQGKSMLENKSSQIARDYMSSYVGYLCDERTIAHVIVERISSLKSKQQKQLTTMR